MRSELSTQMCHEMWFRQPHVGFICQLLGGEVGYHNICQSPWIRPLALRQHQVANYLTQLQHGAHVQWASADGLNNTGSPSLEHRGQAQQLARIATQLLVNGCLSA
eukprot:NODE_14216_length_1121_cov_5.918511.p4 GENE.NODE_14216_length_1121_cov_5.918511~~NODE_14216_length_1121_cov_5.918511.p4  ORF type:complete len:106 (+),score=3.12 NODE_14216_length_1121_cov_5.918511:592-909(+)